MEHPQYALADFKSGAHDSVALFKQLSMKLFSYDLDHFLRFLGKQTPATKSLLMHLTPAAVFTDEFALAGAVSPVKIRVTAVIKIKDLGFIIEKDIPIFLIINEHPRLSMIYLPLNKFRANRIRLGLF
jgi:hypothetical protein